MSSKSVFILIIFPLFLIDLYAQKGDFELKGRITELEGSPIAFASISIDSLNIGATSDLNGNYIITNIPKGNYEILVSYLGYKPIRKSIIFDSEKYQTLNIELVEDVQSLDEVTFQGKTQAQKVKESAYSVNVIDIKAVQDREVTLNQLMTQSAGIRVRESGGLGSTTNYSLDGMGGRSVRFFIDGVPLDRFGSAYGINNFPVNLIERIEIFKGVVPPQFGSDALGGVINLVTKNKKSKYLDASYSFGSFNTHRAAISSRWVHDSSNFYVDAQAFFNYSKNNYSVWGDGVEVADPNTGRAIGIKTKRFHDAYRSFSGKLGFGFFDKKWADQFNINFIGAGNHKEIQHGNTMASVYGEAQKNDNVMSPSLYYSKSNLFGTHLNFNLYSSVSFQQSILIDTSSRRYDWTGAIVNEHPNNSELGSGNNGKSLLTLNSTNWYQQVGFAYNFNDNHKLMLNYTYDLTNRSGKDPFIGNRTASYLVPQDLQKQVTSLGYELITWKILEHSIWVKNYDFSVSSVKINYITDSLGYRPITSSVKGHTNDFGFGYALKYKVKNNIIVKFSTEKSFRLPDVEEILGDGLFVRLNPDLKPEESININLGFLVKNIELKNDKNLLDIEISSFLRNVNNQILYQLQGTLGTGIYNNIAKVKSYGVSLDARYSFDEKLRIKGNVTFQQPRDWNEFNNGARNITYKDLLPNTPYLMANGEISFAQKNLFIKESELNMFWELQYVHQFYLQWPSLGNQNKAFIPTQFVNNLGASYSLENGKYNVSIGAQNIFNEQVYDNYLLQKPGRSFYTKFRILI